MTVHIEARGVSKRYGGVEALRDVAVAVERGTVHALVGENGAGKSTLGRIVAGVTGLDAGALEVDGKPVHFRSPRDAHAHGISMIAQELMIVPQMTVLENVFLGMEPRRGAILTDRDARRRFRELVEEAGLELSPNALAGRLSVADQQKTEILRTLARNAEAIIMDEPTAALSSEQSERLLESVKGLRERGKTVIYVSHFLEEVLEIADTITVLKDGDVVRTGPAANETTESLVLAMLGRPLDLAFPAKKPPELAAPVVIEVDGLRRAGAFEGISFDVREGEILGLAGLVGSGRTEVARAIFGADPVDGGEMRLRGGRFRPRSPHGAISAGVALLPESRKQQGLLMNQSITDNMTLPHLGDVTRYGVLRLRQRQARVQEVMSSLGVRAASDRAAVGTLSGGNQQKILLGRWLFVAPELLIADEPTRGVDVGAKRAIYELIAELAAGGMAVILISSEFEEVYGLAHRLLVLRNGRLAGEFAGDVIDPEAVMRAAFGAPASAAA